MTLETLQSLAPNSPTPCRPAEPNLGESNASLENTCTIDEQEVITRQYEQVKELLNLSSPDRPEHDTGSQALKDFLANNEFLSLEDQLISMAEETDDKDKRRLFLQLLRGPFEGICNYVMVIRAGTLEPEYIRQLYYLARDQAKIMRNLLRDLDPEGRAHDEQLKRHNVKLLLEKWESTTYQIFRKEVEIQFQSFYDGDVAERCLEFAELDRIFYHLLHHCAYHGINKHIDVAVGLTGDEKNLIFAFQKTISKDRELAISTQIQSGDSLFDYPGEKSKRFDLAAVGDAVTHAFGCEDRLEAERRGLFGANLEGNTFTIWFLWPALAD